ncbi:recombination regulator RecX [Streptococcus sp. DD12]|uniref:recombination regulator RecX n=1 Tax=Streptococcus sp. DD12 TaxID=1777880 RepID=UPI000834A5F4|nr:recombination regulator RecX [Streptococcus sp. DD12]
MKITKLEKKKRLYLLELDSSETLYITEDTLVRFFLSKGKSLTESELAEIRQFSQFSYGKNLALYHLSFARRSQKQVQDYLMQHDIDQATSQAVIASLIQEEWLNDRQLAKDIVHQQATGGDKGPFYLKQKLGQKGIAKAIIAEVLDQTDFTEACLATAEKLCKKYEKKLPQKALETKLYQQLSQRGYAARDIQTALAKLPLTSDPDQETDLLFREIDKVFDRYARKNEGYALKQKLTNHLARKGFTFDAIHQALREYDI